MSLSHPDFPIFSFCTWMGGDRLVLMEIWREPLKSPPSTLVKSRQQNVGGSFYKIWRHDPYKLFKVICLDCIFNRTMLTFWERKQQVLQVQNYCCPKSATYFTPPPTQLCANIWETFDHPAETKSRSCDSLLEMGFEPREGKWEKLEKRNREEKEGKWSCWSITGEEFCRKGRSCFHIFGDFLCSLGTHWTCLQSYHRAIVNINLILKC